MEKTATLQDLMKFFGMTPKEFTVEWKKLTQEDRDQIRRGVGNGTLTY